MNLRLRRRCRTFQKIKIASFVRLPDMFREQLAESTFELARFRYPLLAAFGKFLLADFKVELAARNVEFDDVTCFHQRKRSTDP